MRALLLAAGWLSAVATYRTSTQMLVPINGRPLLDYWLENLLKGGVEEVIINTTI